MKKQKRQGFDEDIAETQRQHLDAVEVAVGHARLASLTEAEVRRAVERELNRQRRQK